MKTGALKKISVADLQTIHLKTILSVAFLSVFLLMTGLSFYFLYKSPVVGVEASWDDRSGHWKVVTAQAPFRTGDALVSIEGRPVGLHQWLKDNIHIQNRKELFTWFAAKKELFTLLSAPSVTVTVMRDSGPIELRVPVHPARFTFLARAEALHWVLGAAFFLIGLVVFWKRKREEVSLVFFLLCMALTLSFTTNAASMTSEAVYEPAWFALMNILNIPNPIAIGAFMLHFSLLMPEKRRFLVRFPWAVWPFYAFCAIMEVTLSIGAVNFLFPVFSLGGLAAMSCYFFRSKDPIQRQQLKWVLAGFGFGFLPFILINGIPMIVTGKRLVADTIPGFFFIFIPLFTAFAIQKFRLMEIDSLLDNTLVYGATFGVLTVMDLSVVGLLSRALPGRDTAAGFLAGILNLWLVIILYVPVRNRFRHWAACLLKRGEYDFNDVSTRVSTRLILAPDVPAAFAETMDVLHDTLHPRGSCAYLFSGRPLRCVFGEPWPNLPSDMAERFRSLNVAAYLYPFVTEQDKPSEYASGVVFPLIGHAGPVGCVLLKGKVSNKPYSRKDLSLLNMVGRQLSLALESISAKETAQARERESREMKERISQEMHDGIGSTFSNAIMMLDLISEERAGPAGLTRRRSRIGAMRDTLADGLADVRALITTMEEKEAVLGDIRDSVEDKVRRLLAGKDVACDFAAEIDNDDLPLSPLVVHHITRIVQEAVTNTLKHSRAEKISVVIREREGILSIRIADNGRGLELGSSPSGRYGLRNMERRCSEIGAELQFYSEPGKGFEIAVSLAPGQDPV